MTVRGVLRPEVRVMADLAATAWALVAVEVVEVMGEEVLTTRMGMGTTVEATLAELPAIRVEAAVAAVEEVHSGMNPYEKEDSKNTTLATMKRHDVPTLSLPPPVRLLRPPTKGRAPCHLLLPLPPRQ